jgi:tRNA 2-selenouridine synthase
MVYDITIEQFLKNRHFYVPIDARSPIEFNEGAIPNAINVPIFSNKEREEIGTSYKVNGKKAAKWQAMEIVSGKIPDLLTQIRNLRTSGKEPVIYCSRGGMRSESLTTFAEMAGLHVKRLQGGYRSFRQTILQQIPDLLPTRAVVLYGMTGTGKTDILKQLKAKGYPVLDLEGYANHKGSLFGAVDGRIPHNQKTFDSLLFHDLDGLTSPYVIMEGESKRIGQAVQPPSLLEIKESGFHIEIESSLPVRMRRIYDEYVQGNEADSDFLTNVEHALEFIKKRIGDGKVSEELSHAWLNKKFEKIIELLIVHYYDSRYQNKSERYINKRLSVNSDNVEKAAEEVEDLLQHYGYYPTLHLVDRR